MQPSVGRRLRVGLVGAGRWGSNYLRVLPATAGVELAVVCDLDRGARNRAQAVLDAPMVVAQADELARFDLDGVIVAVPSVEHAPLALQCLDMGLHVLVEKPLATSTSAAREVLSRAKAVTRHVMVGHITIHHPGLAALRSALEVGELGAIHRIDVKRTSDGARHRRDSALWSLGPHDIANLLFLTRAAEISVLRTWSDGPERARVELTAGAIPAHLEWSRIATEPARCLRIEGADGVATFDERTGAALLETASGTVELHPGGPPLPLLERQCALFVELMRGDIAEESQDALKVVRVLAAAQALLDSGAQKLSPPLVNEVPPSGT